MSVLEYLRNLFVFMIVVERVFFDLFLLIYKFSDVNSRCFGVLLDEVGQLL